MFVNNTNGYVGIGTSSPSSKLEVYGSKIRLTGNAGAGSVTLALDPEGSDGAYLQSTAGSSTVFGSSTKFQIRSSSVTTPIYFSTYDSGWIDRAVILKTGEFGIGTMTPQQKLHVNGSILANGTINATTDVCANGICLTTINATIGMLNGSLDGYYTKTEISNFNYYNSTSLQNISQLANNLGYYNSTTLTGVVNGSGTAMRVPLWNGTTSLNNSNIYQGTSGNIGIGVSNPTYALQVNGDIYTSYQWFSSSSEFGWYTMDGARIRKTDSATDPTYTWNGEADGMGRNSANNLYFMTGNVQRMNLDSSGRVGINSTSPTSTLEVKGTINVTDSQVSMFMENGALVVEG